MEHSKPKILIDLDEYNELKTFYDLTNIDNIIDLDVQVAKVSGDTIEYFCICKNKLEISIKVDLFKLSIQKVKSIKNETV